MFLEEYSSNTVSEKTSNIPKAHQTGSEELIVQNIIIVMDPVNVIIPMPSTCGAARSPAQMAERWTHSYFF